MKNKNNKKNMRNKTGTNITFKSITKHENMVNKNNPNKKDTGETKHEK